MNEIIFNSLRNLPDFKGKFSEYGGRFVAETLMPLILKLKNLMKWQKRSLLNELEMYEKIYWKA